MISDNTQAKPLDKTAVCALHMQDTRCRLVKNFENTNFAEESKRISVYFSRGCKSLTSGLKPRIVSKLQK